ncbi:hypothetical protein [Xanthomonas arboricola]|uniref:hypothetical protein n=1 Tax=Xanthomonas arboricola TaxID=56448 RepID=UPI00128FF5D9|nr:hypothetical protein [Xanthomonas arboricola]
MSHLNDIDGLRAKIKDTIKKDLGVGDQLANPFADSIMQCFSGERLYFPAIKINYPVDEIEKALQSGLSVASVTQRYELSRATLYKLFPAVSCVKGGE